RLSLQRLVARDSAGHRHLARRAGRQPPWRRAPRPPRSTSPAVTPVSHEDDPAVPTGAIAFYGQNSQLAFAPGGAAVRRAVQETGDPPANLGRGAVGAGRPSSAPGPITRAPRPDATCPTQSRNDERRGTSKPLTPFVLPRPHLGMGRFNISDVSRM